MVVGVDQYKRIKKMAAEEGLSQREIARRLGISRNTVARYCRGGNTCRGNRRVVPESQGS